MGGGLQKDGGISFSSKLKEGANQKKAPYGLADPSEKTDEEIEEPKRLDTEELLRQERLAKKLNIAKGINVSGFAVNGGSIVGLLFVVDNFVFNPSTLEFLELIFNKTLGFDIDFPNIINLLQEYKAQIIGGCISMQTMLMGYKDTCQKMKERDTESFMEVVNEELEKIGI